MKPTVWICFLALIFSTRSVYCGNAAAYSQVHRSAKLKSESEVDKIYPVDTTLKTILESSKNHSISSVLISFKVINTSKTLKRICIYQTPLEHMVTTDLMFRVTDAKGHAVKYTGIQAARRPPGPSDYIILQPGESASASIDLAKSFAWVPGKFDVTFVGNQFLNKLPQSNTITITVEP